MIDKFGYIRRHRGLAGPLGRDAFNLYVWCPKALLQLFRESESFTYFFNTAEDGVITRDGNGKITRYV